MKVVKHSAKVDISKCKGDRICETACPSGAIKVVLQKGGNGALSFAPCRAACPSNVDAPGYIALAGAGRLAEAYQLIRKENPFPAVCGRICTHPCEMVCSRRDKDEPIAIVDLKRYVADYVYEHGPAPTVKPFPQNGKRIGIVGAGPSGLTCGYYLALLGYAVEIYECQPVAGGVLAFGIPEYRLPKKILQYEISLIEQAGIKIHLNMEVGKDVSFETLKKKHDALYLATGAQIPTKIGIPGEGLSGVYHGLNFLRDVHLQKEPVMGKKVIVIGGGNTAIDASRTALRLGAQEVTVLYRRNLLDMPADVREVAEALEEGVKILPLTAPLRFSGKDRVESIECVRMAQGEFDETGRRTPQVIEGSQFTIEADMVIPAVSQYCDLPFIDKKECELTTWGSFVTDEKTLMTSMKGVFAGGDVVRGSDTAIWAIADGKNAAKSIDRYLGGKGLLNTGAEISLPEAPSKFNWADQKRYEMETTDPSLRKQSFEEVVRGFDRTRAVAEANRCMRCDVHRAEVDDSKCLACNVCEDLCPVQAITMIPRKEPLILKINPEEVDQEALKDLCYKASLHPDALICGCGSVKAKEIAAAVLKGARTPEEIALMTGARSGCTIYCISSVLRMLKAHGIEIKEPANQAWHDLTLTNFDISEEVSKTYPKYHLEEDKQMLQLFKDAIKYYQGG